MTIVEFYTRLSDILSRYRISNKVDADGEIDSLVNEAKAAGLGLSISIDKQKLMIDTRESKFDEITSYDGELEDEYDEDDDSYSYDEDDENSEDDDTYFNTEN